MNSSSIGGGNGMHLREVARQRKRRLAIDGKPFKKLSIRDVPASQRLVLALMDGVIARAKPDPEEIVPLSKAAPPEPQAGEGVQEEAREGVQAEEKFIAEYVAKKQAKKPRADFVIVTSSDVPPPLKMGSKQQMEAMTEVAGMMHMLPSEIKGAHGPTGQTMVQSLLHVITFGLDALKAMPLSELDQGAWYSVAMAHRAKIDAVIVALKQEAKTS